MNRGLLLALAICGPAWGCTDEGGPRLDAVTPAASARNTMVTVTGQHLCGAEDDCTRATGSIVLGLSPPLVQASVVSAEPSALRIVIPSLAEIGATHLVATVDDRSSNALPFEVLP